MRNSALSLGTALGCLVLGWTPASGRNVATPLGGYKGCGGGNGQGVAVVHDFAVVTVQGSGLISGVSKLERDQTR